jgi:Bacterial TniB protein.
LKRDKVTELSNEERIRAVERMQLTYPRLTEVLKKMAYCHQHSKISVEPRCMLVTGWQGVGKTTVCQRYEQMNPRAETEDGTRVPVLTSVIQPPATVKSLATSLLESLGDPAMDRGTLITRTLRVKWLLKECGVELIIWDEFQHVIDRESLKVLQTSADWLKVLIERAKIPIILCGMPSSHVILDANPQLRRRFSMRVNLEPFSWATAEAGHEFRQLLGLVESGLPLQKPSHLADPDIAFRLFCATGGFISSVMEVVRRGTALAIESGIERLSREILEQAYDECLAAGIPEMKNPFSAAKKELQPSTVVEKATSLLQRDKPIKRGRKLSALTSPSALMSLDLQ